MGGVNLQPPVLETGARTRPPTTSVSAVSATRRGLTVCLVQLRIAPTSVVRSVAAGKT